MISKIPHALLAVLALMLGCEAADAQQITPVRQSKLDPRLVIAGESSGSGTSTVVFNTAGFAAMQLYFNGSGMCAGAQNVWEVSNLPPYVRVAYASDSTTVNVSVEGAALVAGPFTALASNGVGFLYTVATGGPCAFNIYSTMVPWPNSVFAQGPYREGVNIASAGISYTNPVLLGGLYQNDANSPATVEPRTLRVTGSGEVVTKPGGAGDLPSVGSPVDVDSAVATVVWTFTAAFPTATVQNVGTADLYCLVGTSGGAKASSTLYHFVLAPATGLNKGDGGSATLPDRYSPALILSCRASAASGRIAVLPTR